MADYFEEMGWEPLGPGETPNHLLHLVRLLRDFGMWEELGQDQRLPPPTSKQVISNLEEKEINVPGLQCPVCLKEHSVGENVKVLPCKHSFHTACIVPWLEKVGSAVSGDKGIYMGVPQGSKLGPLLFLLYISDLPKTSTCPLCRLELPTDDEEYEKYKQEKKRAKAREEDIETLHNSMFS